MPPVKECRIDVANVSKKNTAATGYKGTFQTSFKMRHPLNFPVN